MTPRPGVLRPLLFLLLISGLILPATPVSADVDPPVPLFEVMLPKDGDRDRLQALDLDVVQERPGVWARVLGWPGSREALIAAGFQVHEIEADYGRALALRNELLPAVPAPGMGSMGGYYTLAEVNALLDSLSTSDSLDIVSPVDSIGAGRQGRAIRAIRIADESQPDNSRPRVLFTALTHAREPGGMQALFHFMDRLISNYGSDPNLTYLVNEREIWFVPCVNPDGYKRNEDTYFNSGSFGLWRKNLRDNDMNGMIGTSDGVDNNRNFGFQWGFDNTGSSPTSSSQTYRGPSAFSEPETRALRDFCVAHTFSTANNYHTYAEICIYPWGYNAADPPDVAFYTRLTEEMMRDAAYAYGVPGDILYTVNGDANDWMYGDQLQKPKVLSVTTEVGDQNDGFWPPMSRINPLSALQEYSNITLAYAAGTFLHPDSVVIVSADGFLHPGLSADVSVRIRSSGLLPSDGDVMVTATTSTAGITVIDGISTYPPIDTSAAAFPQGGDVLTLGASPSVPEGTIVPLILTVTDAGDYVRVDTVEVTVGQPLTVFEDHASGGLANWTAAGGFGIQNISGDSVFTDSPSGNYAASTTRSLTLNAPLDLSGGLKAYLTFRQKYEIEGGYDCGQIQISTNGTTWTSLAGRMTRPGHGNSGGYSGGRQVLNEPCYDATQLIEATETIDISPWAGLTNVLIRFRLLSDSGTQFDGWRIDDIKVVVYPEDVSAVTVSTPPRPTVTLSRPWPNPSAHGSHVTATFAAPTPYTVAVYGVDGRLVRRLSQGLALGERDFFWDGSSASGGSASAGRYYLRLEWDGGVETRSLTRVR